MWRISYMTLLGRRPVSYTKLYSHRHWLSHQLPSSSSLLQFSSSSSEPPDIIPESMENAKTLEDILTSIEEQSILDDERRAIERPTPYYTLLHYPSRAAWRSSDHILGDPPPNPTASNSSNSTNSSIPRRRQVNSLLGQTQFNIIQHSERTNKQLKRTYKRIMDTQKALAVKRERERRLAANYNNYSSLSLSTNGNEKGGKNDNRNNNEEDVDGAIEDGQGRYVGDWREKRKNKKNNKNSSNTTAYSVEEALCDDPSVALSLSMGLSSTSSSSSKGRNWGDIEYDAINSSNSSNSDNNNNKMMHVKSAKSANRLAKSSTATISNEHRPVGYGAEQTLTNLRYRFGPNYSIVKRVLTEVQSLMGGKPKSSPSPMIGMEDDDENNKPSSFKPRRVLDFGCGVGSSGAAVLDVFGVSRQSSSDANNNTHGGDKNTSHDGIEWIHSVDASQSMRETTDHILQSILQSSPWDEKDTTNDASEDASMEDRLLEEEMAQYEQLINDIRGTGRGGRGGGGNSKAKLEERQRKRMEKWEHTWIKHDDARTRLTFGESIVDTSSFYSDGMKSDEDDSRPALPWQAKLDEQRRQAREKKKEDVQQQSSSSSNQKKQGSFDLILCSYTLSELPSVPSSLAAATLLWEKLANNGVLVFVEPGTPDGFGLLRSVRSMLLECCPPPELMEKRRKRKEAAASATIMEEEKATVENDDSNGSESSIDIEEAITSPVDDDVWHEECHVIAPCTHNGTCPMSRHQRDHVKGNTRFGRYEAAAEPNEDVDSEEEIELRNEEHAGEDNKDKDDGDDIRDVLDNWDNMSESDKDELKTMFGGEDMSDDEVKSMLEYMDSEDLDSDEEEDLDSDSDHDDDEQEYYNIDQETASDDSSSKKASTMAKTDVFDTSFCSFVHKFPGGSSLSKGEKFTYLVLQKRVPSSNDNVIDGVLNSEEEVSLDDIDVVEMMSKSVHHGQQLKKEELRMRLQQKRSNINNGNDTTQDPEVGSYHQDQANEVLQRAVDVEDAFLDSNVDSLGLEMLTGDNRRKGWGRLIRAPLKRKGHVLIDYCSAGCGGGCSDDNDWFEERPDGTQGRIIRQKVSRGWSARSAPGCYSAARRARWGGLWPDLVERVKRQDEKERKREMNRSSSS